MIFHLTEKLVFPHPQFAEANGLLAIGGDLSPERLLLAYSNGIFPWFQDGEEIYWYAPDPRFVLFPEKVHISKSMKKWLKKADLKITVNQAFRRVIKLCQQVERKDQDGSWISNNYIRAYTKMFELGHSKSVEVWQNDNLVGGLYGVELNECFFGESMFQTLTNASKFALIFLCTNFSYKLIDCQVYTPHMESMGAEMILLNDFLDIIQPE